MYTTDKHTEQKVEQEQEVVKEKGQQALKAVHKIRSGDVPAEMPTTETVEQVLERGERTLESLQQSERGQQLGSKGQQVIEDVKRVLEDERKLVEKNEGDLIQNIVRHGKVLVEALSADPSLKGLTGNWNNFLQSVSGGNDFEGLMSNAGELVESIKNTEQFLTLASELISMTKILITEKSEQVQEGESIKRGSSAHQADKDAEREKMMQSLRDMMSALSSNYLWCDMVQRGRLVASKGKAVGEQAGQTTNTALEAILDTENVQCLIEDVKTLIQRIAGDSVSVDEFFEHSKEAWWDMVKDDELSCVISEVEDTMRQVADNPQLADDPFMKEQLKSLSRRAETAIEKLKQKPSVALAREESQQIVDAIKYDPANRQIVDDAKQLWKDVKSDRPGELIDPELLMSLRQAIVPLFFDHLANVPIPPVHDSGDFLGKFDYSIENIHISVPALIPEDIHVRFEYEADASPFKLEVHNQRTFVFLEAKDIQIHLRDIEWSYSRHTVPRLHDSGRLDVDTHGKGVTIRMKMELKNEISEKSILEVMGARIIIDKWDAKVSGSKHDHMYEWLSHMFANSIKRAVQKAVEKKLMEFGGVANTQLLTLISDAKQKTQGLSQLATSKVGVAKDAANRMLHGAKEKAQEKKENAKQSAKKSLNHAQEITNDGAFQEAKDVAKDSGKGLLTLAAEKANELLSKQQEKLERRRTDIKLGYQRAPTAGEPSTSTTQFLHPAYSNNLKLSLGNSLDNLSISAAIPPTPPPSPLTSSFAGSDGVMVSESATVEPYSEPAGEISIPVPETFDNTPTPPPGTWAQPTIPSLGYDVYPNVPSISGTSDSDVKSTTSNTSTMEKVPAEPLRQLNQQGQAL